MRREEHHRKRHEDKALAVKNRKGLWKAPHAAKLESWEAYDALGSRQIEFVRQVM